MVEAVASRDAQSGQLWLNIGTARVPARLASGDPSGPVDGEVLKLRVMRDSPVVALETLAAGTSTNQDPIGESLRRSFAGQTSPAGLLANAGWLLNGKPPEFALPLPLQQALANLWMALPSSGTVATAAGLAAAIRDSGLFLESRLSKGSTPLLANLAAHDLKALLLALQSVLGEPRPQMATVASASAAASPLPLLRGQLQPLGTAAPSLPSMSVDERIGELSMQTRGALARLTATQLINASAQGLAFLVEIPVRHDNEARLLRFRFERQPDPGPEPSRSWSVEAVMTLTRGETVHARVAFVAGRIGVQLRSDSAPVVEKLKTASEALSQALRGAGVQVSQVVCRHGLPAADPGESRAHLVDLRA